MASLPRRNVPPPMSTTASGSNNAVMPVTSPAFSLATNNRSKSWGSLAGSLVVESFIVTLRQLPTEPTRPKSRGPLPSVEILARVLLPGDDPCCHQDAQAAHKQEPVGHLTSKPPS